MGIHLLNTDLKTINNVSIVGIGDISTLSSVNWEDINGLISDSTSLTTELNLREDTLGNPLVDGYILSSAIDGTRTWIEPADNLGNPTTSGYILSSATDGTRTWVEHDNLGNPLVDGYILSSAIDGTRTWIEPADNLGNPLVDGYILSSAIDGTRTWIEPADNLGNPLVDGYILSSETDGTRTWIEPASASNLNISTTNVTEGVNLYYTDLRVDTRVDSYIQDSSVSSTSIYSSQKIEAILSSNPLYKGVWDASTNTPLLSNATGTNSDFYKVSVEGSQDLGSGVISFLPGDDIVHNGTVYEKIENSSVISILNDLQDVSNSLTPNEGEVLTWRGTEWTSEINESAIPTSENIKSTENQTEFFSPYNVSNVDVFVGGIKIHPTEYTALNGTSIIFNNEVDLDTWIQINSDSNSPGERILSGSPTFTTAMKTSISTETNDIDFTKNNNFSITAVSGVIGTPITTNSVGQSGFIIIYQAENITGWDSIYKFKTTPSGLSGEEVFNYFIESETSIRIGKLL